MQRRQTSVPSQWLITDGRLGDVVRLVRRLPRGSAVLVRDRALLRSVRRAAAGRAIRVAVEGRRIVRVHDAREIARAQLAGAELLLLSALYPTRSHPGRPPLGRMRAAALVRLARVPVIALGGMDAGRFRRVRSLGFVGWAGIDAWLGSYRRGRHGS